MNMFLDCRFVPFSKISLYHWQPWTWTKYPRFYAFAQNFPLVIVQCPSRFIPMKGLNLIFFSLPLLYEADFSVSHNKVLRVAQVAVGSSTAAVLLLRWRFSHKIMEVENSGIWQRVAQKIFDFLAPVRIYSLSFPPLTHPTCLNRGVLRGWLLPQSIEKILWFSLVKISRAPYSSRWQPPWTKQFQVRWMVAYFQKTQLFLRRFKRPLRFCSRCNLNFML